MYTLRVRGFCLQLVQPLSAAETASVYLGELVSTFDHAGTHPEPAFSAYMPGLFTTRCAIAFCFIPSCPRKIKGAVGVGENMRGITGFDTRAGNR